jgi:hypothetical protein
MNAPCQWILTAPAEPLQSHRGDVLGFRLVADDFAERLVPGLTNRSVDARWFTLLCWCVALTRDRANDSSIYEWIRPLELVWIAAAVSSDQTKGRQLPGIRAVKNATTRGGDITADFGLTRAQARSYRFIGPYGIYRMPMIKLGFTDESGWCLKNTGSGMTLAELVDHELGQSLIKNTERINGNSKPYTYWCNKAKQLLSRSSKMQVLLPCDRQKLTKLPNKDERRALRNHLFGNDSDSCIRAKTLQAVKSRAYAENIVELYTGVVADLKRVDLNAMIPFVEFADAAVGSLNAISTFLQTHDDMPYHDPGDIADAIKDEIGELSNAARSWLRTSSDLSDKRKNVDNLASALAKTKRSCKDTIAALIQHHEKKGNGQRWLTAGRDGKIGYAQGGSSLGAPPYRFRLASLCRMSVQVGAMNRNESPASVEDNIQEEADEA